MRILTLLALCALLTSCAYLPGRVGKEYTYRLARRKLNWDTTYVAHTLRIPGDTASLRISLTQLRQRTDTVYSERQGRATVTVRVVRDTVYASAVCDTIYQTIQVPCPPTPLPPAPSRWTVWGLWWNYWGWVLIAAAIALWAVVRRGKA